MRNCVETLNPDYDVQLINLLKRRRSLGEVLLLFPGQFTPGDNFLFCVQSANPGNDFAAIITALQTCANSAGVSLAVVQTCLQQSNVNILNIAQAGQNFRNCINAAAGNPTNPGNPFGGSSESNSIESGETFGNTPFNPFSIRGGNRNRRLRRGRGFRRQF